MAVSTIAGDSYAILACNAVVPTRGGEPALRADGELRARRAACADGDWVESLTALVETLDGELQLVTWTDILAPGRPVPRWNDDDDDVAPLAAAPVTAPAA